MNTPNSTQAAQKQQALRLMLQGKVDRYLAMLLRERRTPVRAQA